ncbi:HD domain-containing phosphohydrolase [Zavarzinia sp.]|uniref:HD domain-containing phosphohydrolase n=1 Tax=Zavarzinia sp. TaxID=2027920 RepID=UPI003BB56806
MTGYAVVNVGLGYWQTRQMLLADAEVLFEHIGGEISLVIDARYEAAAQAAEMIAAATRTDLDDRLGSLPLMVQAVNSTFGVSAAYVGFDNGSFLLVRRYRRDLAATRDAPAETAYLVQSIDIEQEGPRGSYRFYDAALRLLGRMPAPDYRFDPRTRPWYAQALASAQTVAVDPYIFFTTREIGTSVARRTPDGRAVAGIDITLDSLSLALSSLRPTKSADLFIFDRGGRVIVDPAGAKPVVSPDGSEVMLPMVAGELRQAILAAANRNNGDGKASYAEIGETSWMILLRNLGTSSNPLFAGIAAPRPELLVTSDRMRNEGLIIAFLVLLLSVPVTLALSGLASRPVEALTRAANRIRALRFDTKTKIATPLIEIDELAHAMDGMTATIRQLLGITATLTSEGDFDRLLTLVIDETSRLASARGGVIYLAEADGSMVPSGARWAGKDHEGSIPVLHPEDVDAADHPVIRTLGGRRQIRQLTPEQVQAFYPGLDYAAPLTAFAIPLRNREGETVGALMLLIETAGEDQPHIPAEVVAVVEAVSGTAAVSIETRRLIIAQRRLFNGVITMLAGSIDTKSPYTGTHCQRVPALMEMLAGAAVNARSGVFRDFDLTEAQWEELRVASWLHDCGKITSPEYVIDKATKLETISDRLHEIRTRFEVVKREAEVACWQAIAEGAPRDARLASLAADWAAIDADFAFVAACNVGSEFMDSGHVARLHRISATRRWHRTLSDRIGLSWEERDRKARVPEPPLPAEESVLADRADHIIERRPGERLPPGNPWGFKVDVPEHLYNRGEIYNLSISRGTLTPEERFKINEHIIVTIRMLSELPFPPSLRNVPEIAGGHHEKMDGGGYPKRLTRDDMSWPARMMAVADIFEALTAGDRPYKRAKTLSAALSIMAEMRDGRHIDPDVFELFLSSGIYRDYADRFLAPEQIDEVDVETYRMSA